jgi:hypothetical protein
MSRTRWEYAYVVWTETVRKITKLDSECKRLSSEVLEEWDQQEWSYYWWKKQTFYIWLPGAATADIRLSWETTDDDYKVTALDIFNELGADGWEVVSNAVRSSAMGRSYGHDTTSFPIQINTLFKRPVGTD